MSSFIEIKQIGKHILLLCLYKRKIKENKLTKKKIKENKKTRKDRDEICQKYIKK